MVYKFTVLKYILNISFLIIAMFQMYCFSNYINDLKKQNKILFEMKANFKEIQFDKNQPIVDSGKIEKIEKLNLLNEKLLKENIPAKTYILDDKLGEFLWITWIEIYIYQFLLKYIKKFKQTDE